MSISTFAARGGTRAAGTTDYRPGTCNIGPAEIRRRWIVGHVGLLVTLALFAILVATDAPSPARFLVSLPAAAAASGYLQAWLKFCAGFGWRGVANFGEVGKATRVLDDEARAADRRRARQISLWALTIGIATGVAAVLLPV